MRLLVRLRSTAAASYMDNYHHKLRGRLWYSLEGTRFDERHGASDPLGLSFSNPFPPGDLEEGDPRTLLVASPHEDLLTHVARDLKEAPSLEIGSMLFEVEDLSVLEPDVGEPGTRGTIETGTGVLVRITPEHRKRYGIDAARNLAARLRDAVDTFNVQQAYARTLPFRESEEKALDRLAARIADEAGNQDRVPVLQLTTRNRPRDRRCLIGLAKRLLADEVPLALVSTQLVEAGVDVSFDTVFRDLAPMDSIVQAAGRCNRSAGGDTGTVTVWWLEAPEDQDSTPAEAVYARFGENLLAHTARALEAVRDDEDEPLSEPCVTRDSVRAYYESLDTANPGDRSMVDDLENARFEELADRSLINQPGSVEIVVVRTEPERLLCENVRECFDEEAYDDARSLVRELRDLQVSVPVYESDSREAAKLSKLEPLHQETDLKLIDLSGGGSVDYVDAVTGGVIVPDTSVEARFL
jgi:hypothetical protein